MTNEKTVADKIKKLIEDQPDLGAGQIAKMLNTSAAYVYHTKRNLLKKQIEMVEPQADPVNHPPHYKAGGIETIDFIEAKKLNYNLGNVVKYITRADLKGNRKQDLEKALWYLKRELSRA